MNKKMTLTMITALTLGASSYAGDASHDSPNASLSDTTDMSSTTGSTSKMTTSTTSSTSADSVINQWPDNSKQVAKKLITKYGQPAEFTANMLAWNKTGPWKRTLIYKNGVEHQFPKKHQDVVHQFVDMKVPVDKLDDLAQFNGSLIVDRTQGELSVRGDSEESNFVALNLAKEIIDGKKTVEQARQEFSQGGDFSKGKLASYSKEFKFTTSLNTADPDVSMEDTSSATGATTSPAAESADSINSDSEKDSTSDTTGSSSESSD